MNTYHQRAYEKSNDVDELRRYLVYNEALHQVYFILL